MKNFCSTTTVKAKIKKSRKYLLHHIVLFKLFPDIQPCGLSLQPLWLIEHSCLTPHQNWDQEKSCDYHIKKDLHC